MKNINNNTENELISEMQRNLESSAKLETMNDIIKVVDYLSAAAEIFEQIGMIKKADEVLTVLAKIAVKHKKKQIKKKIKKSPKKDKHTEGLTPEKMVANLLHHGTEFNMNDDNSAEDFLELDIGEESFED